MTADPIKMAERLRASTQENLTWLQLDALMVEAASMLEDMGQTRRQIESLPSNDGPNAKSGIE